MTYFCIFKNNRRIQCLEMNEVQERDKVQCPQKDAAKNSMFNGRHMALKQTFSSSLNRFSDI